MPGRYHLMDGGTAVEAHGLISVLGDFAGISEIGVSQLEADGIQHPVEEEKHTGLMSVQ